MKNPVNGNYGSVIGAVFWLVLLLLLVPTVWVFLAFNSKYRQCVQLTNGLNLGYEAVFDLSRSYFKPIAVPRFANGIPLIRDDLWAVNVTDTTVFGLTLSTENASGYRFVWRRDTGLVRKNDDPVRYESLIAEAGHANWDINIGSIGTGSLFNELIKRSQFDVDRCQTSLITW